MPTLKKLKYDFHGNGENTIVTIKMDSKGKISADIPLYVSNATGVRCNNVNTLAEAEKLVLHAWYEYLQITKTVERVICVHFKKDFAPQQNMGVGLHLNYLVADKEINGKSISYKPVKFDPYNQEWVREGYGSIWGNGWSSSFNQGVDVGKSTEIPFTQDAYDKIADIHARLDDLCKMLQMICGSEEGLVALMEGKLQMVLGK